MPKTLPKDLALIAIFIEDKSFIIESFAYLHFSKEVNLRCSDNSDNYWVESKNKMTIAIPLNDMNDNIERLVQTKITVQKIGISCLLLNIEATARVSDVLLGELVTIELQW
jgi:hypothetical protein